MCLSLHTFKPGESIRVIICKTKPFQLFVTALESHTFDYYWYTQSQAYNTFFCLGRLFFGQFLWLISYIQLQAYNTSFCLGRLFLACLRLSSTSKSTTDFISPPPPLFQAVISTPTFMWVFFPHPVAIHTHPKATLGADPVQVEDGGVAHVAHLADAAHRALPGHLSCGQERDSHSVSASKFSVCKVTTAPAATVMWLTLALVLGLQKMLLLLHNSPSNWDQFASSCAEPIAAFIPDMCLSKLTSTFLTFS